MATNSGTKYNDLAPTLTEEQARRISLLAALTIAGQLFLLAVAWLLPLISEYRLVGDTVSELALGQYGFLAGAALAISGLTTLGLAYALRLTTKGAWGSLIGSLLIAVYGLSGIAAALFPTDRIDSPAEIWTQSTTGWIHTGAAVIGFICVIVAMLIFTRTFLLARGWKRFSIWAVLLPSGSLALFFAQMEGPFVGLMQRALITLIAVWLMLVAGHIRSLGKVEEGKYAYDG